MSKILVVSDDERIKVEITPMADLESDDADAEPLFLAQCRTEGCDWNSFANEGSLHIYESDAVNDAQVHVDIHERVS